MFSIATSDDPESPSIGVDPASDLIEFPIRKFPRVVLALKEYVCPMPPQLPGQPLA